VADSKTAPDYTHFSSKRADSNDRITSFESILIKRIGVCGILPKDLGAGTQREEVPIPTGAVSYEEGLYLVAAQGELSKSIEIFLTSSFFL